MFIAKILWERENPRNLKEIDIFFSRRNKLLFMLKVLMSYNKFCIWFPEYCPYDPFG